jgi:hypothetical protein
MCSRSRSDVADDVLVRGRRDISTGILNRDPQQAEGPHCSDLTRIMNVLGHMWYIKACCLGYLLQTAAYTTVNV